MEHACSWQGASRRAGWVPGLCAAVVLASLGCQGRIDSPPAGPGRGADDGSGEGSVGRHSAPACEARDVGESDLVRLSRREYANTVRDLLGIEVSVDDLPADDKVGSFDSNTGASVATLTLEVYAQLASGIAAEAVRGLDSLVSCDPEATGGAACARRFIESFGERAYRRPLRTEEVDNVARVYEVGEDSGGFARGIELVLRAMLQSPNMLYRIEQGEGSRGDDDALALAPHELASRLSYFLWDGPPDAALLEAAEAGELAHPEDIAAHTRRMLEDPRAERGIGAFFRQWLGLDEMHQVEKDGEQFPQYTPELASRMIEETERFAIHVVRDGDSRFETLMTAPFTFATRELAALYGRELAAAEDDEWVRIDLDPGQRRGLFTHPSVMARFSHSNQPSTVHRGLMVRERLLCEAVPPPPPDLDATLPEPEGELTLRQYMEQHGEVEACAGCHQLMDPIGYGFLHYDAIGRHRRTGSTGAPVDATGQVVDPKGGNVQLRFDGAPELVRWLAKSDQVKSCFVQQWVTYALGRTLDDEERCLLERLERQHVASGELNVRDLIVDITTSRAFRHRALPEDEEEGR